jgi:hypothetical protein
MMKTFRSPQHKIPAIVAIIALVQLNAHAELYDRGNGMIYDSTLNITWLQDANYAKTSGYDPDGLMTWNRAVKWADDLIYGGFKDWRLASAGLISKIDAFGYDGTTSKGLNDTRSEIGHLFFIDLGNKAQYSHLGEEQASYGLKNTFFVDLKNNRRVEFLNLQAGSYWEAESYPKNLQWASYFRTSDGYTNAASKDDSHFYAWAVRDGDVGLQSKISVNSYEGECQQDCSLGSLSPPTIPVAAAWLFGAGVMGMMGLAVWKRINNRSSIL